MMKKYPWYPALYHDTFRDFVNALARYGEATAICYYDQAGAEQTRSYRQLCDDVAALRRALAAQGLGRGRVAIAGENSYRWLVTFLAVTSGGGVAICTDIDQADTAVRQLILQADAQAVFASQPMLPICAELLEEETGIIRVFALNDGEEKAPHGSFAQLLERGRALEERELPPIAPDDSAAIVFTSGTTAQAKAVDLTHRNLLQNTGAAVATVDLGDAIFTGLPFYHAYGLTCGVLASLVKGARLAINGDLRTMLRDLSLAKCSTVFAVPLMLEAVSGAMWSRFRREGLEEKVEKLLKMYHRLKKVGISFAKDKRMKLRDACFGTVRVIVCGGAHLSIDIARQLEAFGVLVLQGYGITECSPLISVNRNNYWSFDSVGTPLPGCEVKIENGEILVRGPNVMAGYYNDPEATAQVMEDGWFKTGDLGELDSDGQLYITGRSKNLIVLKNGKKISPEKIEQLVQAIPMVKETMVYGAISGAVADDVKPAVSIYPDPELTQGMEQYEILAALQREVDRINATLPAYQQLQMIDIRDKEFVKTSSKKPKRFLPENQAYYPAE